MPEDLRSEMSRVFARGRLESSSTRMPEFHTFERSRIIPSFCPSGPTFAYVGTPSQFRANNPTIIAEVADRGGLRWRATKGDLTLDVVLRTMLGQVNAESLPGQVSLLFFAPVGTSE